ncbi:MAG: FesM [Chloroflexota bacterium]
MAAPLSRPIRRFDLLSIPGLGHFLRWRHARMALQVPMLVIAALILSDGFFGPQVAPQNLAGVLPWVHWRGLVVLALLLIGNVFCMACPFMLPRLAAKKLLPANRTWPSWLRAKWLAAGLLIAFFWAYEAFDFWASPWLTAWVTAAYFLGAVVVDGFFKGAAFCKYVCPIGQFNFVNSLQSPFEVAIRSADTCAACTTKDCIAGRQTPALVPATSTNQAVARSHAAGATGQPLPLLPAPSPRTSRRASGRPQLNGCELWLFQERKVGNLDCTFCLDCIHACPHDNVGIMTRPPLQDLVRDDRRSGIGKLAERPDLAALVLVIVFGGLVNAFGMVSPVYALAAWLATTLGTDSEALIVLLIVVAGTIVAPAVLVGLTALVSRSLSKSRRPVIQLATLYSFALAPVGFGMWLAHYSFHFFAGALTIVPLFQTYLTDIGVPGLGAPRWDLAEIMSPAWSSTAESLFLLLGLAGSLLAADRIARTQMRNRRRARIAFLPWAALIVGLWLAGVWLMGQPMEMRGLLSMR